MKIRKKFKKTETSHIVRDAISERCKKSWHGHSYLWEVVLEGPRQKNGMLMDFIELKVIKQFLDQFDHAAVLWADEYDGELNNFFVDKFQRIVIMKKNPTAENMAALFAKYVHDLLAGYTNYPGVKLVEAICHETDTGSAIAGPIDFDDNDIIVWSRGD